MNKVSLMGRLTKDLEIRTSQSGLELLSFTLAVTRQFKKQGEEKQTDYISCKAFGKTAANIAKFFSKGSLIIIDGKIQTGSYEKEGQKIYTTDVIIDGFYFTGEKKADVGQPQSTNETAGFFLVDDEADEDPLPF